jgi:RNA polymerase sigma factor (sigma-70 family)
VATEEPPIPQQPLTDYQRQLVTDHAPLAKFLARKRWEMAGGQADFDDLFSLANQGLVNAAIRFDPTRADITPGDLENGKAFAGFARQKIIGAILDWQKRDADHVPRSYRTDYKLLQRQGYPERIKSYTKLSELTGLAVDRIRLVVAAVDRAPVSFHEIVNENGQEFYQEPASSQNVEESVVLSAVTDAVAARVAQLTEFQQLVLALRYFVGRDLQDIAGIIGSTLPLVKEAHNAALQSVYAAMRLAAES